jgi:uncharacterized protein with PhoU and TrkA domain
MQKNVLEIKGDFIMFGKEKKNKRFEITVKEGSELTDSGLMQVSVDKETGVKFLFVKSGYGAGLTPLLDATGKVVISRERV